MKIFLKIFPKSLMLVLGGVEMYEDGILGISRVPIVTVQSIAMPYMSVSVCKCINVSEYRCREKKNFLIGDRSQINDECLHARSFLEMLNLLFP